MPVYQHRSSYPSTLPALRILPTRFTAVHDAIAIGQPASNFAITADLAAGQTVFLRQESRFSHC
jgi:hypothetical protein